MSNENEKEVRHLEAPGTAFQVPGPFTLGRYPLTYWPRSSSQVNHERLPDVEDMAGMELAYREQLLSEDAVREIGVSRTMPWLTLGFIGSIAVLILSALIPLTMGLSLGGAAAFIWLMYCLATRQISIRNIVFALLIPPAVVIALQLLSLLFINRVAGASVLGAAALLLFKWVGNGPGEFYSGWLNTHPRLKPETRRRLEPNVQRPNLVLFGAVLAVVVIVPIVSPTIALIVVGAICALSCRRERFGLDLVRPAIDMLSQYLTYGTNSSFAPGVWYPRQSLRRRGQTVLVLACSVAFPLTVGLCFYSPADLLWGRLREVAELALPAAANNETLLAVILPGIDLSSVPEPPGERPTIPSSILQRPQSPQADRARRAQELAELEWHKKNDAYQNAADSVVHQILVNKPHGWVVLALVAIGSGSIALSWLFAIALTIGLTLPLAVLLAVYRDAIVAGRDRQRLIEGHTDESGEHIGGLDEDGRPEWQWYVDRCRGSSHTATDPLAQEVRESEHLFLGVEPFAKFPILLDKSILNEHAYIVGETGSGKTALGIMPLLIQLMRGHVDDRGNCTLPPPMVILDLKGDPALFSTAMAESDRRRAALGITDPTDPTCAFRFFTPEAHKPTHYFNPFESLESSAHSITEICHLFLESLSLSHGEGYGRSYYSRSNRFLLLEALERDPKPRSFEALFERLRLLGREQADLYRQCFELVSTVHALTRYPQIATLQALKRPADAIHMPSLIENRQVAYFWLPAALESIVVREIGKLALYCALTAAIDRQRSGKEPRQVYVVIDEFQRIVSTGFKIILEQARGFGVSLILANQTQSDLKTFELDLRPSVRTNTRFKQFFSVTDPGELHDLTQLSGEEIGILHSTSSTYTNWADVKTTTYGGGSRALSWMPLGPFGPPGAIQRASSESIKTRLQRNDILRVSDHPLDSIIHVSRGNGYTQFGGLPVELRSTWPLHKHEYDMATKVPWPDREAYDVDSVVVSEEPPAEVERWRDHSAAEQTAKFDEAVRQLIGHLPPRRSDERLDDEPTAPESPG